MLKLFVSFTALLGAIKAGVVTEEDLDTGLYYLGCGRSHAYNPWDGDPAGNDVAWCFVDDVTKGREVHARLVAAFDKAERERRIIWEENSQSYAKLSEFLASHGVGSINTEGASWQYNYPTVIARVKEAKLPLEVVYNR